MSQLRVSCFTLSLDGFGAGPSQSETNPLGINGEELHRWMMPTRSFKQMNGEATGGATGTDDEFVRRGNENVGAWILGRNMFGPMRGEPRDDPWRGWWGDDPPFHCPVFVLTHYPRAPTAMAGGTTFHFITGGIEDALHQARVAAGGRDVRVGGGVDTIRQYLKARFVDEMHLAVVPTLLGSGESFFHGLDLRGLGYGLVEHVPTAAVTHLVFRRA